MASTSTTIGPATRIEGKLESDEDIIVEGRIEGGPIHVRGRLTVAARGIVLAEEAEVREAMIVGVFVGNLHAQEVVRIHQDGRLVGDVVAQRVIFVSDKPLSPERHRTAKPATGPAGAVAPAPRLEDSQAPRSIDREAPRSIDREAPRSIDREAPRSPEEPAVAEAAPAPSEAPRSIPPLPGLGQRSMQRKE